MTAEEIQTCCIDGTDAYLDDLNLNDRGINRTKILRKETLYEYGNPAFKLTLAGRLYDPDCVSLELRPPNKTFGPDFFRVVAYDGDAKVVIIEVTDSALSLENVTADSLTLISDLRFLVRNVKRWHASNGLKLQLPRQVMDTYRSQQTWPETQLEPNQQAAIENSRTNPLNYVWGPPGTGKTKLVLAQSVLGFILSGKRIGIFAPTNNAVEQAMEAILMLAERAGIERAKILRVGHPSAKFAKAFPEVCEVQGLQRRLLELKRQVEIYENVLHHRRGATVLNSLAMLEHEIANLQNQLVRRSQILEEIGRIRRSFVSRTVHILDGKSRILKETRTSLEFQIQGLLESIRETRTVSAPLNSIIDRLDFTNIDQIEKELEDLATATRHFMDRNQKMADAHSAQGNGDLAYLIKELRGQMDLIKDITIEERIKSVLITGMTLDCFIGRFHDTTLAFDHIFVDEAGYAPLVKVLTLCRGGIPITLIGDHMQLGPVCEMNEKEMQAVAGGAAIIWRKSSLFIDEAFLADDRTSFVERLFEIDEPQLRLFSRMDLNTTFRFGQNLANVLSEYVYRGLGLVSAVEDKNLEIIVLDAPPSGSKGKPRENSSEAQAISDFIRDRLGQSQDDEEEFVVLAPYKDQISLLNNLLVNARQQGRIMTVHKSQGREWNTVIISLVDGRLTSPWFTDTTNLASGGLYVMNTAVSRARKRLVFACDLHFWINRPEQLIYHLLGLSNGARDQ